MRRTWIRTAVVALLALVGCHGERDQLVRDLKSDRPEIRAGAVRRLADLHDDQDLPVFLKASQDFSSGVRKAAAEALGTVTDPRAVDNLGTLLGDPDEDVQTAAAQSLAHFPGEKAGVYLLNAYARRGTATRASIAKAFGYGPKLQEAIRRESDDNWERNTKALDNGGAAEKVAAAEELGRSGKPEAVERLIPLLGNDAILLAAGAARGLGAAGDRKAVAPLMAVMKENYPALREAASEALGDLADPTSVQTLTQVAAGPDASSTEAAAALARLARAPDTDLALCQIAGTAASPSAAAVAAKAMASRGGCPLQPLISRLSKGNIESHAALLALAALDAGKPEVVGKLAPLVEDKDPQVRLAAIQALGAVGSAEAAPPLLKIVNAESKRLDDARAKWVKDPMPKEFAEGFSAPSTSDFATKMDALQDKVKAAQAERAAEQGQVLHEPRPAKMREVIADVGPDDGQLLGVAATALGRTRAPEAADLLEKLSGDSDDSIREGALVGLAYLGGDHLKKLQAAWADLSPEAVAQAADALHSLGDAGVPVLIAGLAARTSERAPLAQALGQLKAVQAIDPLEKLLGSVGDESAAAAEALGQLAQPRSVKPLVELLKDPRAAGRVEAIEALGRIKDPGSREAVVRELFSDRPESRAAAVRAVSALGGNAGSELEALRADYYREVRRAVEQVLGGAAASK